MKFKTPLAIAKGVGSARSGSEDDKKQRASAIVLVFLVLWFVYMTLKFLTVADYDKIAILNNPLVLVAYILFCTITVYHAFFGLKMIIEDYVHCILLRTAIIVFVQFFCFATIVAGIIGGFVIHITFISVLG